MHHVFVAQDVWEGPQRCSELLPCAGNYPLHNSPWKKVGPKARAVWIQRGLAFTLLWTRNSPSGLLEMGILQDPGPLFCLAAMS